MRRWNGWGLIETNYHLPESAAFYLEQLIGAGEDIADASLEETLQSLPDSDLPAHPLIKQTPMDRLMHARGQSLPDWIALRHGRIGKYPDGVAYPKDDREVRSLLEYARQTGVVVIPYGGGTSVVGHINPLPHERPVLCVDLSRINQVFDIDQTSRLATFGAGINGPTLEKNLNERGYTLGHFPQSFELSTLGGWIATRSSGQQSYRYGRIEDLFAGGQIETPLGALELPPFPASAAGPDLRQLFLGSEGRLGIITKATVRVRPIPAMEGFFAAFFHDWQSGTQAVRQIAQERIPISMARLSDEQETITTLALSGKDNLVALARFGLQALGYGQSRSLLIYGITGDRANFHYAKRKTAAVIRAHGGLPTGPIIGKIWRKSRFLTPYLRNTLWERGYALDTLETAVPWARIQNTAEALKSTLRKTMKDEDHDILVFAHLSHVYQDGASIYITFLFRRSADPEVTLARWQKLKAAASQTLVNHGGTISHQHGVGLDHAPYLAAEKGALGMHLIKQTAKVIDPDGMMNPGKLFEGEYHVDRELAR